MFALDEHCIGAVVCLPEASRALQHGRLDVTGDARDSVRLLAAIAVSAGGSGGAHLAARRDETR